MRMAAHFYALVGTRVGLTCLRLQFARVLHAARFYGLALALAVKALASSPKFLPYGIRATGEAPR